MRTTTRVGFWALLASGLATAGCPLLDEIGGGEDTTCGAGGGGAGQGGEAGTGGGRTTTKEEGGAGAQGGAGGDPTTTSSSTDTATRCECPEGYQITPAGDACFQEIASAPVQHATVHDVCPGDASAVYGKFGGLVEPGGTAPGGTAEMNAYWGDGSSGPLTGRLNEVGVWACGAGSMSAGTDPVGEWIGFAVCVDIPESGEYILGIAGDNRVRMDVDGATVYLHDTGSTQAFNYWHLLPIHLTSGTHIVELRGKNDGSIAAFGAEVSGPFPPGSLDTDAAVLDEAAYAAGLLWSTGDLIPGQTFQLGEQSGWQCPAQTALDVCAPKPVCKEIDYVSCLGAP